MQDQESSGLLDGQWMFTDNYLNKLGSQPIPHLVGSVSHSSILLKEMHPFTTYGLLAGPATTY